MRPRSCNFHSAYATASPCSAEISTPLRREGISGFIGAYSSNTWLMSPLPRVILRNSDWKPINPRADRKSTRLNSSHGYISYAVFCLQKKVTPHDYKRSQH